MITLWNTLLIEPIYNGLIFFINTFPGHSLGIAVIVMTLIVKFLLFPIASRSIRTQAAQKKLQPEIKSLQAKYKDNKEELSKKMMELYKERKVNPFSGCLLLIIQLPIILALYRVIIMGVDLQPDLLYSVLQYPPNINTVFLGLFELTERSIPLAILAGAAQFLQMSLSPALRAAKKEKKDTENSQPMEQAAAMMQKNLRYFMPIMIVVFGWALPGAVALYWVISALFLTAQEYFIYKTLNVEKHDNSNNQSNPDNDTGVS
jgi:YidC/Oxa1 family membrane protein insertase